MNKPCELGMAYPIEIHRIAEEDSSGYYYIASLPDFGASTCSAVGDTPIEALEALMKIREDIIRYFIKTSKKLPIPSKCSLEQL